jgi:hypothetical protein
MQVFYLDRFACVVLSKPSKYIFRKPFVKRAIQFTLYVDEAGHEAKKGCFSTTFLRTGRIMIFVTLPGEYHLFKITNFDLLNKNTQ